MIPLLLDLRAILAAKGLPSVRLDPLSSDQSHKLLLLNSSQPGMAFLPHVWRVDEVRMESARLIMSSAISTPHIRTVFVAQLPATTLAHFTQAGFDLQTYELDLDWNYFSAGQS